MLPHTKAMPPFAALPAPDAAPAEEQEKGALRAPAVLRHAETIPARAVCALADLADPPHLLLGDEGGGVSAWCAGSGQVVREFQAHSGAVRSILVLRSPRLARSLEEELWPDRGASSPKAPSKERVSPSHAEATECPASPAQDEDRSASKAGQGPAVLQSALARMVLDAITRGRMPTRGTTHCLLATAGDDGAVRLWRCQLPGHEPASSLPSAPSQGLIAEWASDGRAPVLLCAELHDGHLAVAVAGSPDVRLLNPATLGVRCVLFGHTKPVTCLAECLDGRVATGSKDGAVRLWGKSAWQKKELPEPGDGMARTWGGWEHPEVAMNSVVSGTPLLAHGQQAPKSEYVHARLRVLVQRAASAHEGDEEASTRAQPMVRCALVEGEEARPARTPARTDPTWGHRCALSLQKALVDGQWQYPSCARVACDVFASDGKGEMHVGSWTASLDSVLAEIWQSPAAAAEPRARKLHSPVGCGPQEDLCDSVLFVGFERRGEHALDCLVLRADGLPYMGSYSNLYVTVALRQGALGGARRISTHHPVGISGARTPPAEIFDLEVPVCLMDRHMVQRPGLHLVVETYDPEAPPQAQLLGALILPLAEVLKADSREPCRYDLSPPAAALSEGTRGQPDAKPDGLGGPEGLRGRLGLALRPEGLGERLGHALNPGELVGHGGQLVERGGHALMDRLRAAGLVEAEAEAADEVAAPAVAPGLYLSFQTILPCPLQLRCRIDCAQGLRTEAQDLAVRMRFVEGDPLLPWTTLLRTRTQERTLTPVWRERLTLRVPKSMRHLDTSVPLSVKAGWEHRRPNTLPPAVIRIDLCKRVRHGSRVRDTSWGHAVFPLATAVSLSHKDSGVVPKQIHLECPTPASVWVGFWKGNQIPADHMMLMVEKATIANGGWEGELPDLYCTFRLLEHGDPAEQPVAAETPAAAVERDDYDFGYAAWRHGEVLELPGFEVAGLVAARPDWHLLLEIVDPSGAAGRVGEGVLASAAMPLTSLLSDLRQQAGPLKEASRPSSKEEASPEALAVAGRRSPTPNAALSKVLALLSHTDVLEGFHPFGVQPADDHGRAAGLPQAPAEDLGSSGDALARYQAQWEDEKVTTDLTRGLGKSLGIGRDAAEPRIWRPELKVHFELVSRWAGLRRDAACPPARPMAEPTPVSSVVALASSLVAGYDDGNVVVWDATGCLLTPLHQFHARRAPASMTVCPGLDRIAMACSGGGTTTLQLLDLSTFRLHEAVSLQGEGARCQATFRRGGAPHLALASGQQEVLLLQLARADASDVSAPELVDDTANADRSDEQWGAARSCFAKLSSAVSAAPGNLRSMAGRRRAQK